MRSALLLVMALLLTCPARANDTGDAQAVIQSQVDAFRRNDSDAAYALAAPAIQNIFPQASFMGMVQTAYPPVFRHKRFEFGDSRVSESGAIVQRVGIVDGDDVAWEAIYTLEKQPDGSWKISGCVLRKVGTAV